MNVKNELPVPPQGTGVVGTFQCAFIYHSEHYGLIFKGYHTIFTRSHIFIFVYISIFSQVHMRYVFNVI